MTGRQPDRDVMCVPNGDLPASGQDRWRELRNNNDGVPRLQARASRLDLTRNLYEARHHLRHI